MSLLLLLHSTSKAQSGWANPKLWVDCVGSAGLDCLLRLLLRQMFPAQQGRVDSYRSRSFDGPAGIHWGSQNCAVRWMWARLEIPNRSLDYDQRNASCRQSKNKVKSYHSGAEKVLDKCLKRKRNIARPDPTLIIRGHSLISGICLDIYWGSSS